MYFPPERPNSWADLVGCPPKHLHDPVQWWCGNHQSGTLTCEVGPGSRFVNWTMATITTQIPLLPQQATSTPILTSTSTPDATSPTTTPNISTADSSDKSHKAAAIGAGIGAPLGIAVVGFLVYLFWRERRHNRTADHHQRSWETVKGEHLQPPPVAVACQNCSRHVTEIDGYVGLPELPTKTDFQRFER